MPVASQLPAVGSQVASQCGWPSHSLLSFL